MTAPRDPAAGRHWTDPPDFRTHEAVTLCQLPPLQHPWSTERHQMADDGLSQATHLLRIGAHDPRLPKAAREWLWHAFTLAWKAREALQTVASGMTKHHDAERRRLAAAAAQRRAAGED